MAARDHLHEEGTEEVTLTQAEAAQIALDVANREWGYPTATEELIILSEWTRESPIAWAFVYNTRSFAETDDIMKGLMGNGPVVVIKATGAARLMPSGLSATAALQEIEGRADQ